jgi:hypothetical protein
LNKLFLLCKKMNIAVVIDDRYFGFFEPFLHEYDCVITMGTVYNIDHVKHITCVMTTRVICYSPYITSLTLYQTEQLSRTREIERVVYEIQEANQKCVKLRVLDYSKTNMKLLQDRVKGMNLNFEHVYAPIVTPYKEKNRLTNLLKTMSKEYDFALVAGMSVRRQIVKDALEKAGFTVKHIENSFSLERDVYTAQCRYLLNIHADDDFQIFETARCIRWLDAGMTVITEPSLDLEEYKDRPNLKIIPFSEILRGNISYTENWIEGIVSAWKGHRKFAEWLVNFLNPLTIVDLGVDYGYSTFVFQNSLREKKQGTVYGIDLFFGDESTGNRDTFKQVTSTIQEKSLDRIEIIRGDFNCIAKLWTKPIQILHIDGSHLYENVKENFYAWSPFVVDTGIILFHDTAVESPLFGVKKFFDEIKGGYKLNFPHSSGLGVYTKNEELFTLIKSTFAFLL